MSETFERTRAALDHAAQAGERVAFFWRDDDATRPSDALEKLLQLRARHGLPLALAVIPHGATRELAERLGDEAEVAVWQHGFAHANHAPAGEKKAEFGDHRPAGEMDREIREGRRALETLFAERFRPVFVPPWNRIGEAAAACLAPAGISTLSAFAGAGPVKKAKHAGRPDGVRRLDTHVDLMHWHPPRGLSLNEADQRLAGWLEGRAAEVAATPIGILTHHLQHDAAAWATLDGLLASLSRHEAAAWPALEQLG